MSLWPTVLLAAVGAALLTVFEPVTWALMAELAGESWTTARGCWRPAINSVRKSEPQWRLRSRGWRILVCLGAAIIAALVIGAKLRGIGAIRAQAAGA